MARGPLHRGDGHSSSMGAAQLQAMLRRGDKVSAKAKQRSATVRGAEAGASSAGMSSPARGHGRSHSYGVRVATNAPAGGAHDALPSPMHLPSPLRQRPGAGFQSPAGVVGGGFRGAGLSPAHMPGTGAGAGSGSAVAGAGVDGVRQTAHAPQHLAQALPSGAGVTTGRGGVGLALRAPLHTQQDQSHAHTHAASHPHGLHATEVVAAAGAAVASAAVSGKSRAQVVSTSTALARHGSGKTIIRRKRKQAPLASSASAKSMASSPASQRLAHHDSMARQEVGASHRVSPLPFASGEGQAVRR